MVAIAPSVGAGGPILCEERVERRLWLVGGMRIEEVQHREPRPFTRCSVPFEELSRHQLRRFAFVSHRLRRTGPVECCNATKELRRATVLPATSHHANQVELRLSETVKNIS